MEGGQSKVTSPELKGICVGMPIMHHMIVIHLRLTKQYMISIHTKNITKDLTTIRPMEKRDKSLFRNSYLASLLKPLKSIRGGMHLSGDL